MNININTRVEVTLTEVGANWLNAYNKNKIDYHRRILEQFHASENQIDEIFPTNLQAFDNYQCSLWELMEIFGRYFSIDTSAPFVNNDINFLIPEC